ncbi:hypothetical protein R3P38DRAFT_695057 [Favolaschia claudopus]|uniref:Uncharacterized protein n=1 Tax=Favolaschia claudopus TaxID=2862362 RepID=A0AAW0EDA3_9AGAR
MPSVAKSASLVITLTGGLVNSFLTLQLAGSWSAIRALDAESELDAWKFDGLRVLWALLALYLLAAAFISFVGFFGVLRNKPPHVRLYRDCASADLAFAAFLTVLAGLAARAPARAFCEHPDLAPLIAVLLVYFQPTGSNPDEACERTLEHTAIVALAALVTLTVVRLHFLLAVSTHYSAMTRPRSGGVEGQEQRSVIRLLPLPRGVQPGDVVYAPVHCPSAANSVLGAEAEVWVRAPSAPAYVIVQAASPSVSPAASPAVPAYAPAYVQAPPQTPTQHGQEVELDAGLLSARVVNTKREWI